MPRASLSIAIVALGAGLLLGRWTVRPDPGLQDSLDSLQAAGAMQDPLTTQAVSDVLALRDSLRRERQARAQDSIRYAALTRRRMPTPMLAAQQVPDTCRPAITRLVDQLAIRDSLHELDSATIARQEAAIQSWDRVAAGLAKEAIAEHVLRQRAEELAAAAIRRSKVPRIQFEAEPWLTVPDMKLSGRVDAVVHVGGRWRMTGGYTGATGEAGTVRVGLRFVL